MLFILLTQYKMSESKKEYLHFLNIEELIERIKLFIFITKRYNLVL